MREKVKGENQNELVENAAQRAQVNHKAIVLMRELLENVPPARLKKNLLNVLFVFLENEHKNLPPNFETMLHDYYRLYRLLDEIDEEMKGKVGESLA